MADENLLNDYMLDFSGGQNAALDPDNIPENTYAAGVNTSTQTGTLRPRWGFEELKLDFSNETSFIRRLTGIEISAEKVFKEGRFQALIPYSIGADYHIIAIISGYLFLIHQDTKVVEVLNKTDPININAARINWSNAGRYLVIFDYPSFPLIVEGVSTRRADPAKNEVPVSVIGTYNQNRLFIGNAGNEFTAGDPSGSLSTPDAPITFNEIIQNSSPYVGQIFQLPTNYGNDVISAMGFLQFTDSSTGIGPLLVSTPKQIFSYQTQNPRSAWLAGQFGSSLLSSAGIAGQRAFTNINSDLLFVSPDGQVRALSMSRDQQRRWANVPISREVQNYMIINDVNLVQYTPTGYYMNKAFFGANPFRTIGYDIEGNAYTDYAFGGFTVLEMDNIAGITSAAATPVWAGLWTGIRPMDMAVNNQEAFVISKDPTGNALYKMNPSKTYDEVQGKVRYVRSILYTRSFVFKTPTLNKQLHSLDIDVQNIKGDFKVAVSYKPSHGTEYTFWRDYKFTVPDVQCTGDIKYPNGVSGQSIRDFYLGGVNATVCNPATQDMYAVFKKTQLRFELTGKNWELTSIRIKALGRPQSSSEVLCKEFTPTELPQQCLDDWSIYDPSTDCN